MPTAPHDISDLFLAPVALEIDRNQTPIMKPTMRAMESLVIMLRPTGEMHSSAIEWIT